MDRRYLDAIAVKFGGGPVGVETIAAALSEPRDAIEDIIEPYLIQLGFVQRTPRGRLLTPHAFRHLGLPSLGARRPQPDLFEERGLVLSDIEEREPVSHIVGFLEALASERGASVNTIDAYRRDLTDYEAYLKAKATDALKADTSLCAAFWPRAAHGS